MEIVTKLQKKHEEEEEEKTSHHVSSKTNLADFKETRTDEVNDDKTPLKCVEEKYASSTPTTKGKQQPLVYGCLERCCCTRRLKSDNTFRFFFTQSDRRLTDDI